jgi:hypothetical protein
MKISITVQSGKENKTAVITLTRRENAEYVFKRLYDAGWLVVAAQMVE